MRRLHCLAVLHMSMQHLRATARSPVSSAVQITYPQQTPSKPLTMAGRFQYNYGRGALAGSNVSFHLESRKISRLTGDSHTTHPTRAANKPTTHKRMRQTATRHNNPHNTRDLPANNPTWPTLQTRRAPKNISTSCTPPPPLLRTNPRTKPSKANLGSASSRAAKANPAEWSHSAAKPTSSGTTAESTDATRSCTTALCLGATALATMVFRDRIS